MDRLPQTYGLILLGPSGSGKSTLAKGISQFLQSFHRNHILINLDPANDTNLISVQDVMEEFNLGPNGSLIYAIDFLKENMDWLLEQLQKHMDKYWIFDLPGQMELFLYNESLKEILTKITNNEKYIANLSVVSLFDSTYCYSQSSYISCALQSLTTMINLELPQINLLTKVDLLSTSNLNKLTQSLEYYFSNNSFSEYWEYEETLKMNKCITKFEQKYQTLTKVLCNIVDEFGLVNFLPVSVENKLMISYVLVQIDKANGYMFTEKYNQDNFHIPALEIKDDEEAYLERIISDLQDKIDETL